jgi:hypothetical protein
MITFDAIIKEAKKRKRKTAIIIRENLAILTLGKDI